MVTKLYGDGLLEAKDIVREVAEDIRLAIEAKSNVTGLATTFPAVLSVIRPGATPVPYTETHCDFYSYEDSALHFTSILYLRGAEQGGELYLEREEGEEREVKPTKGTLFTFTSGEENRHRAHRSGAGIKNQQKNDY